MSTLVGTSAEPIPGYTLLERIGAGGYGEVWRAAAPGGLAKAIKFVYGFLTDERASGELKALNRIRQVRHPFLLSLERIEVIDGRLVIVTELADESLKDRFEACRRSGLAGIPRDELLRLLCDAADALDYMSETHSLQHLDVKPENLLLLGGRIKVADFGLVKDVHATGLSMMGGMTPVYSAPEVFDGRPSRFSDQYSLAVVYQELLTGEPPFCGKTAAQLAKQHSSAAPRLAGLPPCDQRAIATSLAKTPRERFPSCRALIDALRAAGSAAERVTATPATATPESEADTKSLACKETQTAAEAGPLPLDGSQPARRVTMCTEAMESHAAAATPDFHFADAEVRDLPPLETATGARLRPTLFLGLGGVAVRVLGKLRQRLHERFGGLELVPALQFVAIDTDADALFQAAHGDTGAGFTDHETVLISLRSSQDYRNESNKLLPWLSRRWLYNIPRSLKTEGLRPLGRLALIDRADQVRQRVRTAIETAASPLSLEQTAKASGAEVTGTPLDIVLVAATGGGTGGGALIDLAYLARQVASEIGVDGITVRGMMLHGTGRRADGRDLAVVNTYAVLTELYTFNQPRGFYPGDTTCGLCASQAICPTFDDMYFVHLGDELEDAQLEHSLESVADYLCADTASTAGRFLDVCRELARESRESSSPSLWLRSFGITQAGLVDDQLASRLTHEVCSRVVRLWRGDSDPDVTPSGKQELPLGIAKRLVQAGPPRLERDSRAHSERLIQEHALVLTSTSEVLCRYVTSKLGVDSETFFRSVLHEISSHAAGGQRSLPAGPSSDPLLGAIQALSQFVGLPSDDESAPVNGSPETYEVSGGASIDALLAGHVDDLAQAQGELVIQGLLALLDEPAMRVAGMRQVATKLDDHFRQIEQQCRGEMNAAKAEAVDLARKLTAERTPDGRKGPAPLRFTADGSFAAEQLRSLLRFAECLLRTAVHRGLCRWTQAHRSSLSTIHRHGRESLQELQRLECAYELISKRAAERAGGKGATDNPLTLSAAEVLEKGIGDLAARVDLEFQRNFIDPRGGLAEVLLLQASIRSQLPAALRTAARKAVRDAIRQVNLSSLFRANVGGSDIFSVPDARLDEHAETALSFLRNLADQAEPGRIARGGMRRTLLVVPEGCPTDWLVLQPFGNTAPSIAVDPHSEMTFCREYDGMPLPWIAARLIEGRPDLAEIAGRVLTRFDVEWSRIPLGACPGALPRFGAEGR